MTRNWEQETKERVAKIKQILTQSGAGGVVFGASGGKDSALVGILCKMASDNTLGVIMPCDSALNYTTDKEHALMLGKQYGIEHVVVDLTSTKNTLKAAIGGGFANQSEINIAPRLRMTALYAIAANRGALVAGTSNRSEIHMGYFTKWGDAACDFNPIKDLTKTEVQAFLAHLGAPKIIHTKPPSASLFDGQTDEADMGITYDEIDAFLLHGEKGESYHIIERYHEISHHKRNNVSSK